MAKTQKTHVTMKVNGAEVEGLVEPRTLLVHFIRENLLLTGTHIAAARRPPCAAPAPSISGWHVGEELHHAWFAVQAEGADIRDHRGRRQCRMAPLSALAGRLPDDARAAMSASAPPA